MCSLSIIRVCPRRQQILQENGHLFILGGPGSGKTTIALLKAAHIIEQYQIASDQIVLFLSFARATVTRINQQFQSQISPIINKQVEINTYHGFAWNLIRNFGYLLTGKKHLTLLPPPTASARLAHIAKDQRNSELRKLLDNEGVLGFDLFASFAANLIDGSNRLSKLIADFYPVIIVDEFQDTNFDEWQLIQALGKRSRLIALADPEQRIYEFRGADPARIGEFIHTYNPSIFDFGMENNRSNGTDIITFANDLLVSANHVKEYKNVKIIRYRYDRGEPLSALKYEVLNAMRRLKQIDGWSIAILVNSRRFMLNVSSYLSKDSRRLKAISHDVSIDPEGPALAAILIGDLMDGAANQETLTQAIIRDLVDHMRGRNGSKINQADLKLASALEGFLESGRVRGRKREAIISEVRSIAAQRQALSFNGNPENDWLAISELLSSSNNPTLQIVAEDAKFFRLLNRGMPLRVKLSEQWRLNGFYTGTRLLIEAALLQEHFSTSSHAYLGINLMTIHKSKGKEFDEVIIFEGVHQDRLLRQGSSDDAMHQAKLSLRVAVTRAKMRATILTSSRASCPLI